MTAPLSTALAIIRPRNSKYPVNKTRKDVRKESEKTKKHVRSPKQIETVVLYYNNETQHRS